MILLEPSNQLLYGKFLTKFLFSYKKQSELICISEHDLGENVEERLFMTSGSDLNISFDTIII